MRLPLLLSASLFTMGAMAADFVVDGISYNLISVTDQTVEVTSGEYSGNINIPDVVTYNGRELSVIAIGEQAFSNCQDLTGVSIGKNVKTIGASAFIGTTNLAEITIPTNVDKIDKYAFNNSGIQKFTLPEGEHYISVGNSECWGQSNKKDYGLLYHCPNLKEVFWGREFRTIETSYYRKGESPFRYNKTIEKLTLAGKAATTWKMCSFAEALKTVIFAPGYEPDTIEESAFEYCTSLTQITIPGSIKTIKEDAFDGCSSLSNLELQEGVEKLGNWCFSWSAIEELTIPSSVQEMNQSFQNSTKMKKITTYSNCPIKGIGWGQDGIPNIECVVFGPNVETVTGPDIFNKCIDLKEVHAQAAVPPVVTGEFSNQQYLHTTLYVPFGSLDAYKNAEIWKNFWNIVGEDTGSVEAMGKDNTLYVRIENGVINILGTDAGRVASVYTLSGQQVLTTTDDTITGLMPGCYIVKVAEKYAKIRI